MDYKHLLILMYLNEYKDTYLLSDIRNMCNCSLNQLYREINLMSDLGLLSYKDDFLCITENGHDTLSKEGFANIKMKNLSNDLTNFKVSTKKLSFDDVYIPKRFKP